MSEITSCGLMVPQIKTIDALEEMGYDVLTKSGSGEVTEVRILQSVIETMDMIGILEIGARIKDAARTWRNWHDQFCDCEVSTSKADSS